MKLDQMLAQKIVKRTMKIIHQSVNVMDENGVIIASGDPSRLGQKHTGAVLALRQNRVIEVDDELAKLWRFEARAGINLPIHYLGKHWGVVGISGDPEQVRPYAELVKMTAELIIEQHLLLQKERWDHRYKEAFLLQWLKGSMTETEMQQQAQFFSVDLTLPRTVILVKLLYSNTDILEEWVSFLEQNAVQQAVPQSKEQKSAVQNDVVVLNLDQLAIITNQPIEQINLTSLVPTDVPRQQYKLALGATTIGNLLHFSYKTAQATLEFGLKSSPKKSCYFFEQHKLPVLLSHLSPSWQAEELLKPTALLYENRQYQSLVKTLKQYFLSNCDLALTAEKLFIHTNTLRYRLTKIEYITGLSFNNIEQKFLLYLSTILTS